MNQMRIQNFHIVIRPALALLPELAEVKEFIEKKLMPKNYIISQEKGNSSGDEVYNHYDCVVETQTESSKGRDAQSIRRSIKRWWNFDTKTMYNVFVSQVKPPRDIRYQIGYALKEGIHYETTYKNEYLTECTQYYLDNPESDGTAKKWSVDQIIEEFEIDLKAQMETNTIWNKEMVETIFNWWARSHFQQKKFTFTTFQKINVNKLCTLLANSTRSTEHCNQRNEEVRDFTYKMHMEGSDFELN